MRKKELEEMQSRLSALEEKIEDSNATSFSGGYYSVARALRSIKLNKLYKAVRADGKMTYKTFKSYLEHFGWAKAQLRLINKLIDLDELVTSLGIQESAIKFPTNDIEFWNEFFKVSKDYLDDLILYMYESNKTGPAYTIADVKQFLDEHPYMAANYAAKKNVPSPLRIILGNAKRVGDSEIDNMSLYESEDTAETKTAMAGVLAIIAENILRSAKVENKIVLVDPVEGDKPIVLIPKNDSVFGLKLSRVPGMLAIDGKRVNKAIFRSTIIGVVLGALVGLATQFFF